MGMLSGAVSGMGRPVITFVLFTFVKEERCVHACVCMGMLSGAVSGMGRPVITFVLFTFVKEGRCVRECVCVYGHVKWGSFRHGQTCGHICAFYLC